MRNITVKLPFERLQLIPEHAALFVGAALFLTILSPFRTDSDLSIPIRLLYWFGVIFGGTATALTVSNFFQRHANARSGLSRGLVMFAQVLVASVPITLLVAGMEMWLRKPFSWAELPRVFPYVVTITAVITVASSFVKKLKVLRDQISADQLCNENQLALNEHSTVSRFHFRLDPLLRHEEIFALKAEDHYLRVSTSKGFELVRCNLSAAIDELGSIDGQRVHRSFWVARSAILSVKKHGNTYRLVMKDGTTAPVSRRRYSDLRKCDWFPI